MKKDTEKTEMLFRQYLDNQIIALMPYNIADKYGNVDSYMHTGQHSAADYSGVIMCTKPATKKESRELKKELSAIGYNIKEIKKRNYLKYLAEYRRL
jgi:hypothetical protein